MTTGLLYILAFFFGYMVFRTFSHPERKKNLVPNWGIKSVRLLPNIQIHSKKSIIHFHHWMVLSFLVLLAIVLMNPTEYAVTRFLQGAAFGGIIQGLSYEDRFRIKIKKKASNKK